MKKERIRNFIVIFAIISLVLMHNSIIFANTSDQDLKILVIEINPILESITNTTLYPNNNGHPKVSEYFGQDTYKALEELKEDLEFASHGYLNIIMEYEYLNEFPRYKGYIERNSKTFF